MGFPMSVTGHPTCQTNLAAVLGLSARSGPNIQIHRSAEFVQSGYSKPFLCERSSSTMPFGTRAWVNPRCSFQEDATTPCCASTTRSDISDIGQPSLAVNQQLNKIKLPASPGPVSHYRTQSLSLFSMNPSAAFIQDHLWGCPPHA